MKKRSIAWSMVFALLAMFVFSVPVALAAEVPEGAQAKITATLKDVSLYLPTENLVAAPCVEIGGTNTVYSIRDLAPAKNTIRFDIYLRVVDDSVLEVYVPATGAWTPDIISVGIAAEAKGFGRIMAMFSLIDMEIFGKYDNLETRAQTDMMDQWLKEEFDVKVTEIGAEKDAEPAKAEAKAAAEAKVEGKEDSKHAESATVAEPVPSAATAAEPVKAEVKASEPVQNDTKAAAPASAAAAAAEPAKAAEPALQETISAPATPAEVATAPVIVSKQVKVGHVSTSRFPLNLRGKPSLDGEVIGKLPKGSVVFFQGTDEGWVSVVNNEGEFLGFAAGKFIRVP